MVNTALSPETALKRFLYNQCPRCEGKLEARLDRNKGWSLYCPACKKGWTRIMIDKSGTEGMKEGTGLKDKISLWILPLLLLGLLIVPGLKESLRRLFSRK